MWLKCLCFPGLTTLFELNALQEQVRTFDLTVLGFNIMLNSWNLPLASQQVPWPLPPVRSATLDDTTNDDMMIQSQAAFISSSKTLLLPIAACESET